MKKTLLLSLALIIGFAFVVVAADAPSSINLKAAWGVEGRQKSVIFNHDLHQEKDQCVDCHESDAGGKWKPTAAIVGLNARNGAHAICWPCHEEQAVPRGKVCTTCHTGAV